jgi:hypothetical protein
VRLRRAARERAYRDLAAVAFPVLLADDANAMGSTGKQFVHKALNGYQSLEVQNLLT